MKQNPNALQGIFDIESPEAPLLYVLEHHALGIIFITLLLISLSLAAAFFIWRRYFSARGRARRRLAALHAHFNQQLKAPLQNQPPDNHHTAFQISSVLCDGLNLRQLSQRIAFPDRLNPHRDQWEKFIAQLSAARYSPAGNNPEQLSRLFEDAGFWLRCWPVANND
jgi:hypothetical protein